MFTIEYIAKDTGLSVPFIRKCVKQLENILKPHCTKGDFGRILFTESGYVIFDQIKQLKAQGLNIAVIKELLEQEIHQKSKHDEADGQNIVNHISTDMNLLNKLFEEKDARLKEQAENQKRIAEHQQRIFELEHLSQHQQRINELEKLSDHLESQLLYITDGKSPEEYKSAWYQEQMEKQRLETISEKLQGQLSTLTDGKSPEEFKKQLQQEHMDKQRISWILKELESLEGIFSIVNYFKRKKLYKELKELMSKQTNPSSNDVKDLT